ncbi:MAG TPA: TetR/AcrR family transcriptional regulator [Paraburkholderia sp.]|uniref:TetR/AcrR family transcriptional regulator n=1 Tax=Paraburkholderia sp. TaxID=1926495 RepID=UPI002B482952|nr:TetR/AcrR family transcriptional regulator [Paraburkholderia sp.]HKR39440.1 TetR/AcrR family transcriptional regulator [Paraburkholderia sp.]
MPLTLVAEFHAGAGKRAIFRVPTRPGGHAKVDAILDAVAAIIAERGLETLTMHVVARRASTSIDSLYHFFVDEDDVLRALAERHQLRIRAINSDLATNSREIWCALPVVNAFEWLISPFTDYVRKHPDIFPLMHGKRSPVIEADFIDGIGHLLDARLPELLPATLERHAAMLHAIAVGTMYAAFMFEPDQLGFYMKEVPRVMAAYLASIEREVRG